MRLNIVKVLLPVLSGQTQTSLPFLAGKGALFEQRLLEACCAEPSCRADDCTIRTGCPFPGLAARTISPDAELLKRHQKPGLPFVFAPCADTNGFSLVLLGSAIPHLPLFLKALELDGANAIRGCDYQDISVTLRPGPDGMVENLPVLAASELIALATPQFQRCSSIRVNLLAPLRLVKNGHELSWFDPVFFIRSLLRRLSSLAAYYGEGVDTDQVRRLAELAGAVTLVRRTPAAVPSKGRGITGCYELNGPFDELGPLLVLGSLVHLGKGASYGLGDFELSPIS